MSSPRISPRKPPPEPPPPLHRWATLREGAAYLGIGLRTLTDKIATGEVPAYRCGPRLVRVDLNELDQLMVPVPNGAA